MHTDFNPAWKAGRTTYLRMITDCQPLRSSERSRQFLEGIRRPAPSLVEPERM